MAWTTLPTYTDGTVLTAAMLLAIRDNINESAPAKATSAGSHFATTAANAIAERIPLVTAQNGVETTLSTGYTATLSGGAGTAGPSLSTMPTGPKAFIMLSCRQSNGTAGQNAWTSYAISGASTISPSDNYAISYDSPVAGSTAYHTYATLEASLTAGNNTFQMQYRASGGTASFGNRRLAVLPF